MAAVTFVDLIRAAGKHSRKLRRYFRIRRPVSVKLGDEKITILPSDRFLTCDVFFPHPLVGRQVLDIEVTPERYAAEIAPARTFGFEYGSTRCATWA